MRRRQLGVDVLQAYRAQLRRGMLFHLASPAALAGWPRGRRRLSGRPAVPELEADIVEAERQAAAILQEYQELDEALSSASSDPKGCWKVHMKTLTDWVAEFNALMQDSSWPRG